ncbi:ATP-dependent DNA helicase [Aphis craccivora]|uniref:ATP-dependent DNA helicase n=1 Tax=Aphis craccivora TaxID=307492 RepID=A0A6G0VQF0_APHCR|nr:ATP-dependent DNA helicase [Aphis craccivora]
MTGLGLKTLKNRRGWNFDLQISGVDLQILANYLQNNGDVQNFFWKSGRANFMDVCPERRLRDTLGDIFLTTPTCCSMEWNNTSDIIIRPLGLSCTG